MLRRTFVEGCNSRSKISAGSCKSETDRVSAIVGAGATKNEVASLLAEQLGEADDQVGKFAEEADERYFSGSSCEQTYNNVRDNIITDVTN
ncbi:DUF2514 family protein [Citrobacter amalonaticus]